MLSGLELSAKIPLHGRVFNPFADVAYLMSPVYVLERKVGKPGLKYALNVYEWFENGTHKHLWTGNRTNTEFIDRIKLFETPRNMSRFEVTRIVSEFLDNGVLVADNYYYMYHMGERSLLVLSSLNIQSVRLQACP